MKSHSVSRSYYRNKSQEYILQSYDDYLHFQSEQIKQLEYAQIEKIDCNEHLLNADAVEFRLFVDHQSELINQLLLCDTVEKEGEPTLVTHRYEAHLKPVYDEVAKIEEKHLLRNIRKDRKIIIAGFKTSAFSKIFEWLSCEGYEVKFYDLMEQSDMEKIYQEDISAMLFLLQDFSCDLYKSMESVFMHIKHLCAHIYNNSIMRSSIYIMAVVLADGMMGHNAKDMPSIINCVSGLIKSINKEYPDKVAVKYLNIEKGLDDREILAIVKKEFIYRIPYIEIGYVNKNEAYIPCLLEKKIYKSTQYKDRFGPKDVILVTGGAKGITALCIKQIAEQYQCNFIIIGRTNVDEDSYPDLTLEQEIETSLINQVRLHQLKYTPVQLRQKLRRIMDIKEARRTLEELRERGSEVVYISCDITDSKEVADRVLAAEKRLGNITGIIHGAGVLADKSMHQKDRSDFTKVFGTKYWGIINMLSCINTDNLKIMVFFSSIAGYFGNKGQGDYAMANEYLNYISQYYHEVNKSCKTVSINWGPWDGGMVDKNIKGIMERSGVQLIEPSEGIYHFMNEFYSDAHNAPQIVINSSDTF